MIALLLIVGLLSLVGASVFAFAFIGAWVDSKAETWRE